MDSFFLPRRRIASDLVRERRRFDNKKRAVGKVQQHAQQQHAHVRCNSLTLRGGAESAPRSEGLSQGTPRSPGYTRFERLWRMIFIVLILENRFLCPVLELYRYETGICDILINFEVVWYSGMRKWYAEC